MYDYKLKTKMQGDLCNHKPNGFKNVIRVDKGGTKLLTFSLLTRPYKFEEIKQITFIFKYDNGIIDYFTMKDEETGDIDYGSIDAGYAFDYRSDYDEIQLELSPLITDKFPADRPVEYEIAVKLNDDDIIIERQPPLWPVATLYSEIAGASRYPRAAEYCSQSLVCSANLTCCR